MAIPSGHYGRIAPQSSLSANHNIGVLGGVIDADYRGIVKVILFNHGQEDFQVNKGDRVAQIIIEKIANPQILEVFDLDNTFHGPQGFGSTGS